MSTRLMLVPPELATKRTFGSLLTTMPHGSEPTATPLASNCVRSPRQTSRRVHLGFETKKGPRHLSAGLSPGMALRGGSAEDRTGLPSRQYLPSRPLLVKKKKGI